MFYESVTKCCLRTTTFPPPRTERGMKMKPYILFCLTSATMLCGCIWERFQRSEHLTVEDAQALKGEVAMVTLGDSTIHDATILDITADSLVLRADSLDQYVSLANVNDILVEGSPVGRLGGGLFGGLIGGAIGALLKTESGMFRSLERGVNGGVGALIGAFVGGIVGDFFLSPDWRYTIYPKKADVPTETRL